MKVESKIRIKWKILDIKVVIGIKVNGHKLQIVSFEILPKSLDCFGKQVELWQRLSSLKTLKIYFLRQWKFWTRIV